MKGLRSIFLVRILQKDFNTGHNRIPIQNATSIRNMVLLSMILTVALNVRTIHDPDCSSDTKHGLTIHDADCSSDSKPRGLCPRQAAW